MTVLDLLRKRYAAKSFTGNKVSKKDISKMKEAIRLAPSSFNWQPWKVKIVNDKETLKELGEASYNQPQISSASHLFVFCSVSKLEKNNKKLLDFMKDKIIKEKYELFKEKTSGALSVMNSESKRRMSEREIFAAMENLLLVATELGYDSCPVGGFLKEKYCEILNLSEELNPIIVVSVGIASDRPRKKFRFKNKEIFF